ncbi:hypothetical protein BGX27_000893 [Mortierella sp. AM989]|nr:hypothetical protein BGX27_000893 [Mortierella sp. AM989]
MALKQQVSSFQIRNPYRLDRPHFDPTEVWQATIAEDEEAQRLQLSQRPLPPQPVARPLTEASQQNHNYFGQSWFSQGFQQRVTAAPIKQPTQPPVPTITITHHIDSHSELTFERHVEWLTQTALWWDMPVVHLYPAPESSASLEYVETAASKFSSWVNFVKIPAGEEIRLGPDALSINLPQSNNVRGSKALKNTRKDPKEDSCHDGGLVTGHSRRVSGPRELTGANGAAQGLEPILGYVFVGSADEQSQYSQVFEMMREIYPMIEICYINSFEPLHLQSRQQQELREDPCLHSLSWVHYWSAAKESQVLQSKIVNEVVRVRPMWVNNDNLHPNYTPPAPPEPDSPLTTTDSSTFSSTTSALPNSSSVYVGGENSKDQNLEEPLRGIPSTVSIISLFDVDSTMDESSHNNFVSGFRDDQYVSHVDADDFGRHSFDLQDSSMRISRTQSSIDIRQDAVQSLKSSGRSYKKWSFASLGGGSKRGGYRRSVSAPLLLLTKDGGGFSMSLGSKKSNKSMSTMSRQDSDANMSPPPLSPASLTSPTSTSSTISSSSSSMGSLSFSSRLAGLAQRLGVYKKGTSLVVVDHM